MMNLATTIFCAHKKKIHDEGEIVCGDCGMILDERLSTGSAETAIFGSAKSRINLYEMHENGSKEILPKSEDMKRLRRYFHNGIKDEKSPVNTDMLSKFSNVAEKMGLTASQTEHAWRMFARNMRVRHKRHSPETAVWAIYRVCKTHGVPKTGDEIRRAVQMTWGRKAIKHMTGILYDNMDSETSRSDEGMEYYFNLNVRKVLLLQGKGGRRRRLSASEISRRKKKAWHLFMTIFTTGNPNQRAQSAVRMAFGR